jgi:hypothetical protein
LIYLWVLLFSTGLAVPVPTVAQDYLAVSWLRFVQSEQNSPLQVWQSYFVKFASSQSADGLNVPKITRQSFLVDIKAQTIVSS